MLIGNPYICRDYRVVLIGNPVKDNFHLYYIKKARV
jgi:hypothetical protein